MLWSQIFFLTEKFRDPTSRFLPFVILKQKHRCGRHNLKISRSGDFLNSCGFILSNQNLFPKQIKRTNFCETNFLGKRIRKNSANVFLKFGLARAEEGSGEESARASAFFFLAGRALRNFRHRLQFLVQQYSDNHLYQQSRNVQLAAGHQSDHLLKLFG